MASRYINTLTAINDHPFYKKYMEDRGRKSIEQYRTANFVDLTEEQISKLSITGHLWSLGDRYWKLAASYYGDSSYWWVIARYNNAPTECHLNLGDIVEIPAPLEAVLMYMKV